VSKGGRPNTKQIRARQLHPVYIEAENNKAFSILLISFLASFVTYKITCIVKLGPTVKVHGKDMILDDKSSSTLVLWEYESLNPLHRLQNPHGGIL